MIWPVLGLYRALRGRSWCDVPQYARVVNHYNVAPDLRRINLGVRLVRRLP